MQSEGGWSVAPHSCRSSGNRASRFFSMAGSMSFTRNVGGRRLLSQRLMVCVGISVLAYRYLRHGTAGTKRGTRAQRQQVSQ